MAMADDAIAFLIELAEKGEIDPWDVPVIEVFDRFVQQLAPTASTHDLSESGQAFVYASVLVLLKATALMAPVVEGLPAEPEPLEVLPTDWQSLDTLLKPKARGQRTRPVTLKELIDQLQTLDLSEPKPRPKPRSRKGSSAEKVAAITQLAHPENLAETTERLLPLLCELWQQSTAVSLAAILAHPVGNWGSVVWALLLLAARNQVQLVQASFYGELLVAPPLSLGQSETLATPHPDTFPSVATA